MTRLRFGWRWRYGAFETIEIWLRNLTLIDSNMSSSKGDILLAARDDSRVYI